MKNDWTFHWNIKINECNLHSHLISYYQLICSILCENLKCYFILSSLVVRWYPDIIAESLSSRKIIDQSMQNDKPEKNPTNIRWWWQGWIKIWPCGQLSLWCKMVILYVTNGSIQVSIQWCHGYLYCITSFIKASTQALHWCKSWLWHGGDLWQWSRAEIGLNVFCLSTIPQKFIIITHGSATAQKDTATLCKDCEVSYSYKYCPNGWGQGCVTKEKSKVKIWTSWEIKTTLGWCLNGNQCMY